MTQTQVEKKVSKASETRTLLAQNPNITAKDLAEKLNVKPQRAYTLLWKAKQDTQRKVTSKIGRPKKAKTKVAKPQVSYYKDVDGARVLISSDPKALQEEVVKLNGWCVDWFKQVSDLKKELFTTKNQYADTRAVITYLEAKISQLIK